MTVPDSDLYSGDAGSHINLRLYGQLLPWLALVFGLGVGFTIWSQGEWFIADVWLWTDIFIQVGMALISVPVIALLIDIFVAQRQTDRFERLSADVQGTLSSEVGRSIDSISKAEATKLLQSLMPPVIYDQIDEYILKAPHLRRDLKWTLTLEPGPDQDHIIQRLKREYTIVNLNNHPYQYRVDASIDIESKHPGHTEFTQFTIKRNGRFETSPNTDLS